MSVDIGPEISFFKVQGSGNHFVAIDNRDKVVPENAMEAWARAVCRNAFGVGADGIFFIEDAEDPALAYRWHFYNSDGSRAEMCGNASRCVAKLAVRLNIAPAQHVFGTDAGSIRANVLDNGQVQVQLTTAVDLEKNIELAVDGSDYLVHFVNTGVPHVVLVVDDASAVDVAGLGRAIRFHEAWQPAGANVNFIQKTGEDSFALRTYERGVEAETYACGTGAAASGVIARELGIAGESISFVTSGGETLIIILEGDQVYLQGEAEIVYEGRLNLTGLGLSI